MKAYVTILDGDMDILPYFVRHYRRLGANKFPVLIYSEPDRIKDHHQQAKAMIESEGGEYIEFGSFDEQTFTARRRDMHIYNHHKGGWGFFCDLDEFAQITAEEIQAIIKRKGVPFIEGRWIDRVAEGGFLRDIDPSLPLEEQFPFRTRIPLKDFIRMGGPVYVASRQAPRHHHPSTCENGRSLRRKAIVIKVHHFKWQLNVVRRLERRLQRLETIGKKGSNWWHRVRRTLTHLHRYHKSRPRIKPGLLEHVGSVIDI